MTKNSSTTQDLSYNNNLPNRSVSPSYAASLSEQSSLQTTNPFIEEFIINSDFSAPSPYPFLNNDNLDSPYFNTYPSIETPYYDPCFIASTPFYQPFPDWSDSDNNNNSANQIINQKRPLSGESQVPALKKRKLNNSSTQEEAEKKEKTDQEETNNNSNLPTRNNLDSLPFMTFDLIWQELNQSEEGKKLAEKLGEMTFQIDSLRVSGASKLTQKAELINQFNNTIANHPLLKEKFSTTILASVYKKGYKAYRKTKMTVPTLLEELNKTVEGKKLAKSLKDTAQSICNLSKGGGKKINSEEISKLQKEFEDILTGHQLIKGKFISGSLIEPSTYAKSYSSYCTLEKLTQPNAKKLTFPELWEELTKTPEGRIKLDSWQEEAKKINNLANHPNRTNNPKLKKQDKEFRDLLNGDEFLKGKFYIEFGGMNYYQKYPIYSGQNPKKPQMSFHLLFKELSKTIKGNKLLTDLYSASAPIHKLAHEPGGVDNPEFQELDEKFRDFLAEHELLKGKFSTTISGATYYNEFDMYYSLLNVLNNSTSNETSEVPKTSPRSPSFSKLKSHNLEKRI